MHAQLEQYLLDIRRAADAGAWYAALALVLVLPDVCSAAESGREDVIRCCVL